MTLFLVRVNWWTVRLLARSIKFYWSRERRLVIKGVYSVDGEMVLAVIVTKNVFRDEVARFWFPLVTNPFLLLTSQKASENGFRLCRITIWLADHQRLERPKEIYGSLWKILSWITKIVSFMEFLEIYPVIPGFWRHLITEARFYSGIFQK